MLKSQKGFTLIELVMIIVILGILAAVAVPKYVDLSNKAQISTAQGVLGGLRAANGILTAQRAVNGGGTSWGMTDIVTQAQIGGNFTYDTTNFTVTVGNTNYSFTLAPTTAYISTPAALSGPSGW